MRLEAGRCYQIIDYLYVSDTFIFVGDDSLGSIYYEVYGADDRSVIYPFARLFFRRPGYESNT